ncbi:MAG: polyhydroxyalkanoic acid system family protein [Candidatus Caldarchaeum sp.]
MAKIKYTKPHTLGREKAIRLAEAAISEMGDKLNVTYKWEGDSIYFKRPGMNGLININHEAVEVEVELGLLLSPMKSHIERKIAEFFDTRFAEEA